MARDPGLEDILSEDLASVAGLATRPMFGGLAWLHDGHLLCAARQDGMLIRLGAGREGWAVGCPGVEPMRSHGRSMTGWVWVDADAMGDDALRRRLLEAALDFVRALPRKSAPPGAIPWDFPETPGRSKRDRQPKA